MTGARTMGTKAFEGAFQAFRKKSVIAAADEYKAAREIFTATSGNQILSRDAYVKGKAGLQKAAVQLKALKAEADSLTKTAPPVIRLT